MRTGLSIASIVVYTSKLYLSARTGHVRRSSVESRHPPQIQEPWPDSTIMVDLILCTQKEVPKSSAPADCRHQRAAGRSSSRDTPAGHA